MGGCLLFGALAISTSPARAVGVLVTALDFDSPGRVLVPTDNALALDWTTTGFDDSGWAAGDAPFGFGYSGSLAPGTDLQSAMQGISASAYMRFDFDLSFTSTVQIEGFSLGMYYDDGFVAYLNGTEVLSVNAPASPDWSSTATASHTAVDTSLPTFDLIAFKGALISGTNVLAVHGLNQSAADADFLIAPVVEVTIGAIPEPQATLLLAAGTFWLLGRRRPFRLTDERAAA